MTPNSWRRLSLLAALPIAFVLIAALVLPFGPSSSGPSVDSDPSVLGVSETAPDRRTAERAIVPPDHFDGPAPEPEPLPAELARSSSVERRGGTWAVIVGINDYPGGGHDLRSAVNDASDTVAMLDAMGVPAERRVVLTDRAASRAAILASISWLADHAARDAKVLFFYAGHARNKGGQQLIVGSDGATISDVELAAAFDRVVADRVWFVMAACYSAGFDEMVRPGRILTAASGAHELAYENLGFGRSYLVEYMIRRTLTPGRAGTIEAAFSVAEAELRRDYPNRVPVQIDAHDGELTFGIVTAAPASEPPPESSTTTQPERPTDSNDGSDGSGSGDGSGGAHDPDDDRAPNPPDPVDPPPPGECEEIAPLVKRC